MLSDDALQQLEHLSDDEVDKFSYLTKSEVDSELARALDELDVVNGPTPGNSTPVMSGAGLGPPQCDNTGGGGTPCASCDCC